jgi:hypothetical protein
MFALFFSREKQLPNATGHVRIALTLQATGCLPVKTFIDYGDLHPREVPDPDLARIFLQDPKGAGPNEIELPPATFRWMPFTKEVY